MSVNLIGILRLVLRRMQVQVAGVIEFGILNFGAGL